MSIDFNPCICRFLLCLPAYCSCYRRYHRCHPFHETLLTLNHCLLRAQLVAFLTSFQEVTLASQLASISSLVLPRSYNISIRITSFIVTSSHTMCCWVKTGRWVVVDWITGAWIVSTVHSRLKDIFQVHHSVKCWFCLNHYSLVDGLTPIIESD